MRQQRRNLVTQGVGIDPLVVPGLQLELDGQAITGLASSDPLTTWTDTSGHGHHATTTGSGVVPKYISVATLPSGGNAGMAWYNPGDAGGSENGGTFPKSGTEDTQGITYYFWLRSFDAVSAQVIFQDETGGQPQLIWGPSIGWRDSGGTHSINAPTMGYHSLIYVFNPPNGTGLGEVFLDNVSLGTAVWAWDTAAPTTYVFGANQASNAHLDAWVAQINVFTGAHAAPLRDGIRNYLVNKWGWG